MINKVILIGRLTKDPELKTTGTGISVTNFTLAVNRPYSSKNSEQTADFIDIVCWRQQAEFASKYFKKGMQVAISGSIQARTWKDKEDKTRKTVEVVADEVHFAEPRRDGGAEPRLGSDPAFTSENSDFSEISSDEDLPF